MSGPGFAPHPHSGIATLTVFLEGRMTYADSTGKSGELVSGAVEWLHAGRGVWHAGEAADTNPKAISLNIGWRTRYKRLMLKIGIEPAIALGVKIDGAPRSDSNQHAVRRDILSVVRLPFRHWGSRLSIARWTTFAKTISAAFNAIPATASDLGPDVCGKYGPGLRP